MKINTTIPTQSSFPRLCPVFQLFLLMLSVAYDAIHMMSSQSVYQQLAAVYCASRVEIRRRQSPVRVASRRLAASIQFKPASPFASPFAHLQQPTLAGFHGHQPEARHRRHSREVARPLPPARPEQRARELRVHHPFRRRFERVVRPRRASREQARHPAFFVRSFVRSFVRLASPPSRAPRSLVASPESARRHAPPCTVGRRRARPRDSTFLCKIRTYRRFMTRQSWRDSPNPWYINLSDRACRASRSPSIVDDRRDETDRKNRSRSTRDARSDRARSIARSIARAIAIDARSIASIARDRSTDRDRPRPRWMRGAMGDARSRARGDRRRRRARVRDA